MNPGNSTIARLGYISIVCLVLSIIAIGIHKKAYQAVAPPIYDPISYYSKSQIVWDAISHHQWKSVFNQFPIRPPGTALILYPFGFVPSIQSFLFRSTFAPIAIWALALLVIILPKVRDLKGMIVGGALNVGLLTLPIFYHFEVPSIPSRDVFGCSLQWGLVDVLQGSVGALALALIYTGIKKNIRTLIVLAWLVGAYGFFIKPSGILVMGCLFLIYVAETLILWRNKGKEPPIAIIDCLWLLAGGISITAASIWLAFWGGYLSRDVIQTARTASKILIESVHPPILSQLELMITPVFGHWWFLPIAALILVSLCIFFNSLFKRRFSDLGLRALTSAIIFLAALYWWVNMAGQEIRYLFPFIMLIVSWLIVPTLYEWMVSLGNHMRYLAMAYCSIPVICIIALLNSQQGKVSLKIENLFGYNLDVGQYGDEINIGYYLLHQAEKNQRPVKIYSMGNHVGVVEMCDLVNSIEKSNTPKQFTMFRVNDWSHPGIKVKEVLLTDYFLVGKNILLPACVNYNVITDWKNQEVELARFIDETGRKFDSGITIVKDTQDVRLFQVTNRSDFANTFTKWISTKKWSDNFYTINSYERGDFETPGLKVIDSTVVSNLISKKSSIISEVRFGNKITLIALLKNSKIETLKKSDDLLTFIFRADEEIPMKYAIFIHLMDRDKKVIYQHDFQIDPLGGPISTGTYWKSLVTIPESELSKAYYIGFGPYIPYKDGTFLQSNCKRSDWNGNRVLLPLK